MCIEDVWLRPKSSARSCTAVTTSTPQPIPDDTAEPRLLTIAAELRDQIWTFALVKDDPIIVTTRDDAARHEPPGLLKVSSQIRKEAKGIYYTQNSFSIQMHNFDISAISVLAQQKRKFSFRDPVTMKIEDLRASWDNVLVWAKARLEGRCLFRIMTEEEGVKHSYLDAANVMFDFVKGCKGMSWEEIKEEAEWVKISPEGRKIGWSRVPTPLPPTGPKKRK